MRVQQESPDVLAIYPGVIERWAAALAVLFGGACTFPFLGCLKASNLGIGLLFLMFPFSLFLWGLWELLVRKRFTFQRGKRVCEIVWSVGSREICKRSHPFSVVTWAEEKAEGVPVFRLGLRSKGGAGAGSLKFGKTHVLGTWLSREGVLEVVAKITGLTGADLVDPRETNST